MTNDIKVSLLPVAGLARRDQLAGSTAVVFDVLRATSSIITALAAGYTGVYPVVDQQTALDMAAGFNCDLAGERDGLRIGGFPLGNSPREFWVNGQQAKKPLVLTTSNGTAAIHIASAAEQVLIGALLNAGAVARAAVRAERPIVLVCAGSKGDFALEDFLGAGLVLMEIVKALGEKPPMTDLAAAAYLLAESYYDRPLAGLMMSRHGQKLVQLGCEEDIRWCAQLNKFDVVPALSREWGDEDQEPGGRLVCE